jgi:hypothetical protein
MRTEWMMKQRQHGHIEDRLDRAGRQAQESVSRNPIESRGPRATKSNHES